MMGRAMKPGCRYCWSPFDKVCTNAHVHGCRDDTVRLCWICNRAYTHDLFTTRELVDAVRDFEKRRLRCRMNELAAEGHDRSGDRCIAVNPAHHSAEMPTGPCGPPAAEQLGSRRP